MEKHIRFVRDCFYWGHQVARKGEEYIIEVTQEQLNKNLSVNINNVDVPIALLFKHDYIEEIPIKIRIPNDIEIREIYNSASKGTRDKIDNAINKQHNEKPISLEENTNIGEDIYSKKYNIYEILTLIPNLPKDSKFKCSLDDNVWVISHDEVTLNKQGYIGFRLETTYELKQILEATYTIIKPVEEVKEKWVEIETHKDLCTAIVNKKMIRLGDGKPTNEYNDKQIETLFKALEHGVFKIEYLEEN